MFSDVRKVALRKMRRVTDRSDVLQTITFQIGARPGSTVRGDVAERRRSIHARLANSSRCWVASRPRYQVRSYAQSNHTSQ